MPATMCAFAAAAVYTTCDTVARGGGASSSTGGVSPARPSRGNVDSREHVPWIAGYGLLAISTNLGVLLAARAFCGFATGVASTACSMRRGDEPVGRARRARRWLQRRHHQWHPRRDRPPRAVRPHDRRGRLVAAMALLAPALLFLASAGWSTRAPGTKKTGGSFPVQQARRRPPLPAAHRKRPAGDSAEQKGKH